jgi:hypothetical protein
MTGINFSHVSLSFVGVVLLIPVSVLAQPTCADLGTNPAYGLAHNTAVTKLSATSVPVTPGLTYQPGMGPREEAHIATAVAYCQVEFWFNSGKSGPADGYEEGQSQTIGIRVGLPLRMDDGGTGAWNGKIHNLGSGGCMGRLGPVTPATNAGYVGAVSDGGHGAPYTGFNCDFGINHSARTLNVGLIRDFSAEHLLWQTRWSKRLTTIYYGAETRRTYWSGCSQGGREAHIIAQTIPEEYDGVLGGGAALWSMQSLLAPAWPGLVIKDMLQTRGKTLTPDHMAATTDRAIDACDMQDGVKDGLLGDPRRCTWSARSAICGVAGASRENCLDADQAEAYDLIRKGPRNSKGELIWFPFEPDTAVLTNIDAFLGEGMMRWAVADRTFSAANHLYMDKAHLEAAKDPLGITYEDMATLASQRVSDVVDVSNPAAMGWAKASGTKLLMWTGTADRNIQPRNTIEFYRRTAAYFGTSVNASTLQSWYRVFLYPGVAHCGGGDGPWPGHPHHGPLFDALVAWVEQGVAPSRILATKYAGASRAPGPPPTGAGLTVVGTRPVCPYPQTAIYMGSGSIYDAANFTCGGNLETPDVIEPLAKQKSENGTGIVLPPYGGGPNP